MLQLLALLLPVAAGSGWYFGFKHARDSQNKKNSSNEIPEDYFVGLNYLINEQPDKAVDVFIKMLEVNSDTVETHLALGILFRKRGEVDRAIRIHQNVIARPQLGNVLRLQALSELAQDYLCAGVLDRAERLFLELIENKDKKFENYQYLLSIYEQQKNWNRAIEIAKELAAHGNRKMWTPIAYYYCELAEIALSKGDEDLARKNLKRALECDKNCVRASIMLGKIEFDAKQYKASIRACKRVNEQDTAYLPEVMELLKDSYIKLDQEDDLMDYLKDCLSENLQISIVLFLSNYIQKYDGPDKSFEFILQHSKDSESLNIAKRYLEIFSDTLIKIEDLTKANKLREIQNIISSMLNDSPSYCCINCGFSGKQLYWQCPSCKRWSVVKPINDLN